MIITPHNIDFVSHLWKEPQSADESPDILVLLGHFMRKKRKEIANFQKSTTVTQINMTYIKYLWATT